MDAFFDRLPAEFAGGVVGQAAFDAAGGEDRGEDVVIVVAVPYGENTSARVEEIRRGGSAVAWAFGPCGRA